MRKDKEKLTIMEDTMDEERNSMLDKLTKTMSEVDAQKTKYEEMQHVLSAAREDIMKLEQENAKLKEQVSTTEQRIVLTRIHFINCLISHNQTSLRLVTPLLIVCFRSPQTLLVLQMPSTSWMRGPMMMMMIVTIVILIP